MTTSLSAEKLRAYRVLNVTVRLDRAGLEVTGTPLPMILLLQTFTALVGRGQGSTRGLRVRAAVSEGRKAASPDPATNCDLRFY